MKKVEFGCPKISKRVEGAKSQNPGPIASEVEAFQQCRQAEGGENGARNLDHLLNPPLLSSEKPGPLHHRIRGDTFVNRRDWARPREDCHLMPAVEKGRDVMNQECLRK